MITVTCANCVAARVGGAMCTSLRGDGTCQKMCTLQMHTLDTIVRLVTLAVKYPQHQAAIGAVVRSLVDGERATRAELEKETIWL
jgi:hypothetical protein